MVTSRGCHRGRSGWRQKAQETSSAQEGIGECTFRWTKPSVLAHQCKAVLRLTRREGRVNPAEHWWAASHQLTLPECEGPHPGLAAERGCQSPPAVRRSRTVRHPGLRLPPARGTHRPWRHATQFLTANAFLPTLCFSGEPWLTHMVTDACTSRSPQRQSFERTSMTRKDGHSLSTC